MKSNFNHMFKVCSKAFILFRVKNVEKNFVPENIRKINFRAKNLVKRERISRGMYVAN